MNGTIRKVSIMVAACGILACAEKTAPEVKRAPAEARAAESQPEAADAAESVVFGFEDAGDDGAPKGLLPAETNGNGTPGAWRVEKTAQAPEGAHVLTLFMPTNEGERFNLCLTDAVFPADLDVSVAIKANGGKEDQGGGLVWRVADEKNYYVARWNPLENGIVVFKCTNGVRYTLASAVFEADVKKWHVLGISMQGAQGEVTFDGAARCKFQDGVFRSAGKVGLWTKADAASSFDALTIKFR